MIDFQSYLEDYLVSIDNLPSELWHIFTEIKEKDAVIKSDSIEAKAIDFGLRKLINNSLNNNDSTGEALDNKCWTTAAAADSTAANALLDNDQNVEFGKVLDLLNKNYSPIDEKIKLADRSLAMLDRHVKRLISDLEKIAEQDNVPILLQTSATPSVSDLLLIPESMPAALKSASPISPRVAAIRSAPRKFRNPNKRKHLLNNTSDFLPDGLGGASNGEADDDVYCTCRQVSFGNMIACDGDDCAFEWFHYTCVGLSDPPIGVWYCVDCAKKHKKIKKA